MTYMTERLPFDIREAVVQVCGTAFWLKDPLKSLLLAAGVPVEMYERYAEESKFKIARHLLSELDDRGEEGRRVQHQIVEELTRLRALPDSSVPNPDAGLAALRLLKELAEAEHLVTSQERSAVERRADEARRRQAGIAARAEKMAELRESFAVLVQSRDDPQGRGYSLEDLLAELFELHELTYRRPYRTLTEQIDGHFEFKGFDYLVEARWRVSPPTESDLGAFKTKVDKKLTSTRGLFVSVVGFRQEVVLEFTRGTTSSIVLMDGQDLSLILEGHVSLTDALDTKVQKAAQEGIIYFPLSEKFT